MHATWSLLNLCPPPPDPVRGRPGGGRGGTRQGLRGYSTRVRSTDFTRFAGGLKGRFAELAGGGVLYRYIVYRLVYRLSIRSRSTLLGTHTRTEARSPDVATPGLRLGGRGACPRPPARSASRARPVAARPRAGPRVGRKNVVTRHSLQQAAASSSSGAAELTQVKARNARTARTITPRHMLTNAENGLRTRHRRDPAVHEQGPRPATRAQSRGAPW